jgi:hypothetical protein
MSFVTFTYSQELEWNVNLHGFADNQEFSKAGLPSPTIFGTRFSPEVGLRIDSTNRIRIGFNSLHEFGDKHNFTRKIDPVIYYNYQNKGIDFYLGAFPRYQLLNNYPRALLRDPLQYFRPNLEGFLFNYSKKSFNQQVWVDWTSKQTEIDKEGFIIGVSGTVKPKQLYFSHFFTLWHNALTSTENVNEHIQDNAAFVVRIGIDLSKNTFLDSLDVNVGGLMSLDRLRSIYDWRTPKGILLGSYMAYRSFFIKDELYVGEAQYIGYGDAFYHSEFYNRLDLGWKFFKYRYLDASLMASFHFTPGAVSNQQVINLRYNLGGTIPFKRK